MDKKLRRSRTDRKVGGVFGGLSVYTGIDSTVLRLIFIVVAIATMKTGIAFVVYIIATFVIPSDNVSNEEVIAAHRKRMDNKARDTAAKREAKYRKMDVNLKARRENASRRYEKQAERIQNCERPLSDSGKQATSVPRLVRDFHFETASFRTLILKIASGDICLKTWDKEEMNMNVNLTVHKQARTIRQLSEDKIWDYFFSQTMLDINAETLIFEAKKEFLKTDIELTIPERLYEQVKIQLLNGMLQYNDVSAEDAVVKINHGDIRSTHTKGKFLNVDVQDGEVFFQQSSIENIDVTSMRGDITLSGHFLTTMAKTKQGDVELALENDTATTVDLKAPRGDIRIRIPSTWNVDGTLGTKREKIYFDLQNAKIWDNTDQSFVFTQNVEEISTATLQAKVDKGIIKITEQPEK